MKSDRKYRINGFEQIKAFYSWVFDNADKDINTSHISLYLFLINQANRNNWVEWFKCPYDLGMAGSKIGSRNTYYKCLTDLKGWNLIDYEKGINYFKAPIIKIYPLKNEQVRIPNSEQVIEPVIKPLSEPLPEHIYKLITSNLQPITNHFTEFEKFVKGLSKHPRPKSFEFIDRVVFCFQEEYLHERDSEYRIIAIGKERAAAAKILAEFKKKFPNEDSEHIIAHMREFFALCVAISETWLYDNMSLSIIVSKFNEIKTILTNGKHKKDNGATSEEILGAVNKYFPIEGYPTER